MGTKISSVDSLLKRLEKKESEVKGDEPQDKSAAPDEDMGSKDTTHPSADVDNNTEKGDLEGARSAENKADNKSEQQTGVEDAGSPEVRPSPGGSQGVEDKEPEESGDMEGDTKGVSEMLNQDTEHPSKAAAEILPELDEAIKNAEDVEDLPPASSEGDDKPKDKPEDKGAEDKPEDKGAEDKPEDKGAEDKPEEMSEEKLAAYVQEVMEDEPEAFEYGFKLGATAHEQIKLAAAISVNAEENNKLLKKAYDEGLMEKKALGELAPALMGEGAAGAGEEDIINALAEAMAAEGVTPEELAAAIEGAGAEGAGAEGAGEEMLPAGGEMAGDPLSGASDADQIAALEAAMGEAGAAPEDVAGAMADDETVQEEAKVGGVRIVDMKPGSEKLAALITENPERMTKLGALKDAFVADIKALSKTK